MTTLITTAKLNDIDPLAWLADVLARIADIPHCRLPELLSWQWKQTRLQAADGPRLAVIFCAFAIPRATLRQGGSGPRSSPNAYENSSAACATGRRGQT